MLLLALAVAGVGIWRICADQARPDPLEARPFEVAQGLPALLRQQAAAEAEWQATLKKLAEQRLELERLDVQLALLAGGGKAAAQEEDELKRARPLAATWLSRLETRSSALATRLAELEDQLAATRQRAAKALERAQSAAAGRGRLQVIGRSAAFGGALYLAALALLRMPPRRLTRRPAVLFGGALLVVVLPVAFEWLGGPALLTAAALLLLFLLLRFGPVLGEGQP